MKKRLSVNKCNYKREEGHRILGSDMEMRAGYSPAWKVGVGFPEEVTSKVASKPRMKGEKDLAKLRTGKSHGQGHLAPCSMARPISHFHIKDPQDHFQKKKKVDQQEVSMTSELCSVHEMPEAHQSQRRGLKVSPGVGSGELGFR